MKKKINKKTHFFLIINNFNFKLLLHEFNTTTIEIKNRVECVQISSVRISKLFDFFLKRIFLHLTLL